jgi:hypothetical protein
MKKLLIGLAVVIILTLIPMTVTAYPEEWEDCCSYDYGCCCRELCCANQTFDFQVKYKEPVYLYYEQWGFGYWSSVWTTIIVEDMHDRDEVAESLGMRAGYDCWITKVK